MHVARVALSSIIVIALCGCASVRGAGAIRAEYVTQKTQASLHDLRELDSFLDASGATEETKKQMRALIERTRSTLRDVSSVTTALGRDVDANKEIAEKNAVDAKRMRGLYWLAMTAGLFAAALLLRAALKKVGVL